MVFTMTPTSHEILRIQDLPLRRTVSVAKVTVPIGERNCQLRALAVVTEANGAEVIA
jgi:hypothetical protein